MTGENYNENHAASIGYVNASVANAYDKLMTWLTTNQDKLYYVARVIARLKEAYRGGNYETAMEFADAIKTAVDNIATVIQNSGGVLGTADLGDFASIIGSLAAHGYRVCILGKSGTQYSVSEYNEYIAVHGVEPENGDLCVAVINPYCSFTIALPTANAGTEYITKPWGNTTDTVPSLYGAQTGSFVDMLKNALNFYSLENTFRMLMWYNPEILPHCDYDPSDPDKDYSSYNCIRFATKAELVASGITADSFVQVFIVTTDESDSNAANNCYYWNGTDYAKRFPVPRVANNITGSPAAEFAWQTKAWDGDTRQYAIPTINHLLMMYVYYTEINSCLSAMHRGPLPSGDAWTCQQYSSNGAYYVTVSSGAVGSNGGKYYTCAVVPVAAL